MKVTNEKFMEIGIRTKEGWTEIYETSTGKIIRGVTKVVVTHDAAGKPVAELTVYPEMVDMENLVLTDVHYEELPA
jgi:broad specificity phosphatase PhoE